MEMFVGLGQGNVWPLLGQDGQHGAADQGDVGQQVGIAAAGAIFAHERIAPPVIAVFHPTPMAPNEDQSLAGAVLVRRGAGKIIVRFSGGQARFFDRPLAMLNDPGARIGEVRRQWFDGEGMEPPEVNSFVAGLEIGKKGVLGSASRLWGCLKSRG